MEFIYAIGTILVLAMLYDCRRDIRLNQQSLERIAQIANDVHRETNEILRISRGGIN